MESAAAAAATMNNAKSNMALGCNKHAMKLCRRRKARTVFSDQQLSVLEKRFESQKYLSTPERVDLANNLGLSETQVRFNLFLSHSEPLYIVIQEPLLINASSASPIKKGLTNFHV
jgi:hypothetical protein